MAPRRQERNSEDLAGGEGTAIGAEGRQRTQRKANQVYARETRADRRLGRGRKEQGRRSPDYSA